MSNKMTLTHLLLCNIVSSAFLKPMKDSKKSKSAKLGHRMEKVTIKKLLIDSENENVDMVFLIEAAHDTGFFVMKYNQENKKQRIFWFKMWVKWICMKSTLLSVNRCVSRTEEREINQWGVNKHMKINCDDPNFSDTVIEKSEAV